MGWVLNFLCPEEMAEAAVPLRSLDVVGGKAARLHHVGLSPTGSNESVAEHSKERLSV